ncbi:restriction endonuclease subunit S [Listeria welshimeri]|uniref:restriction endonuclease subunit S n=1 Tax=Listeria welshimeri TaxID=1643 RepID=UPI00188715DF|nr:restriction endonuclease subunit S [Listeria welshimeri]MBF2471642.1 restriction endonuclease subunit S [Listeria welshimeri]MBF2505697.1 restriction endonuclease subunit S [Listeria welshimeri]
MKNLEKRVPIIRFKGFSEAWEQRKVLDYAIHTYGGGTPKTNVPEYWSGEIPWIQSSDLSISNLFNIIPKKHITELAIKSSATKFIPANSIAIVSRVGVGKLVFMPFEYTTSQDFLSLSNLQVDSNFGVYSIYMMLQRELNNIQGTSIKGITKSDLLEKKINKPSSREEQQKIGSFFKQLDNTIALHQRKLDALKRVKKGLLQQMFANNEEKAPRLRFINFDEEWEQRKLNEIANRYDNLRVPITASARISGTTPYYGANGIQDYVEGFTHDGEFILVAEDGANNVKNYPVQHVNGKIWVNNHAHVLQAKENKHDNKFLMNAIKIIRFEPFLVGGGRAKLNSDVMMKLIVKFPCYEEQKKIGTFLQRLENVITLHKNKINKLSSLKKTYLQNMLI